MADRKQMLDALKAVLIPSLKCDGFSGSFPHYRRRQSDFYDLMTFQFDKHGGGFVVEIARCLPSGIERRTGHVQAGKARACDRHPNYRKRIKPRQGAGTDAWFRYDQEEAPAEVARAALRALSNPTIWDDVSPFGSETPFRR
jgi:uncharacterized protein DUF4304